MMRLCGLLCIIVASAGLVRAELSATSDWSEVEVNFNVTHTLADIFSNYVYIVDATNARLYALNTDNGNIDAQASLRRAAGSRATLNMGPFGDRLYVTYGSTTDVQVLSLPSLVQVDMIHLPHSLSSMAIGADGYLYGCSSERLRKYSLQTEAEMANRYDGIYSSHMFKFDDSGTRLFLMEMGLTGGSSSIDEYRINKGAANLPTLIDSYFSQKSNDRDFSFDPIMNRLYKAAGGSYGLEYHDLNTGSNFYWSYNAPYGVATAQLPGENVVYGASGSVYDGRIRQFAKNGGAVLHDFLTTGDSSAFPDGSLMNGALEITPNGHVVYAKNDWTGSQNEGVGGYHYYIGLIGSAGLDNWTVPTIHPHVVGPTNRTVFWTSSVPLSATWEDAGPTGNLAWGQISGAGTALFTATNSSTCNVTFTAPGIYRLAVSREVSGMTSTDEFTVTAKPLAGESVQTYFFNQWSTSHFGVAVNPGDDSDGDGCSNFKEYAFVGNPLVAEDSADKLDIEQVAEEDGSTYVHISYPRRIDHNAVDLKYSAMSTLTAGSTNWAPRQRSLQWSVTEYAVTPLGDGVGERVTLRIEESIDLNQQIYRIVSEREP